MKTKYIILAILAFIAYKWLKSKKFDFSSFKDTSTATTAVSGGGAGSTEQTTTPPVPGTSGLGSVGYWVGGASELDNLPTSPAGEQINRNDQRKPPKSAGDRI